MKYLFINCIFVGDTFLTVLGIVLNRICFRCIITICRVFWQ